MSRILTPQQKIERSIVTDFRRDIWNKFVMGYERYDMIKPGDKIAVCISGGMSDKKSQDFRRTLPAFLKYSRSPKTTCGEVLPMSSCHLTLHTHKRFSCLCSNALPIRQQQPLPPEGKNGS